jgi:hypothetical protein
MFPGPAVVDWDVLAFAGEALSPMQLMNQGGPVTACTVMPDLPQGLQLADDCTLQGTVAAILPTTSYAVTVTGAGVAARFALNLTVSTHAFDLRTLGCVTPVKNEGQCVADWAFVVAALVGETYCVQTHTLVSLSEQNLVSCASRDQGCGGGDIERAFDFVKENGITTEAAYPYTARDGTCRGTNGALYKISGYTRVAPHAGAIETAMRNGPVAARFHMHRDFEFYSGGVYRYDGTSSDAGEMFIELDGWGRENGQDYWLAKMPWGTSWGAQGYVKIAFGEGAENWVWALTGDVTH